MKHLITTILLFTATWSVAQNVNKTASTTGVSEIEMDFKYPELIKITAWDKNEVSVTGKAVINNGENDDAFKLNIEKSGSKLVINSRIENIDDLPRKIMIKRNDEKYYFDTDDFNDPKVQAFLAEKGGGQQYQMHGVIKEITLEIKVPRSMVLTINSKYGLVEMTGISAPVSVNAKYGGVDVSLASNVPRNVTARTKYGEMFSDLDLEVDRSQSEGGPYFKWTTVVASFNGGGADCMLESKYGNVYIRKAQ